MTFLDLTRALVEDVDLDKSEIVRPDGLAFLCGGQQNSGAGSAFSLRELILRRLPNRTMLGDARVLLAEEALKHFAATEFDNLLDLEEYIAAIVDSVIVIVESPGSICELGAFVKIEEISSKLIVVMRNDHAKHISFITAGVMKYFLARHKNRNFSYDWSVGVASEVSMPAYAIDALLGDLANAARQRHKKEVLNIKHVGHRIFLVLSICHMLRAAKLSEIKTLMGAFDVSASEKDVYQYLNTLQICGYIQIVKNGPKNTFYTSLVGRIPLKIRFKSLVINKKRNPLRRIEEIKRAVERDEAIRIAIFREHNHAA